MRQSKAVKTTDLKANSTITNTKQSANTASAIQQTTSTQNTHLNNNSIESPKPTTFEQTIDQQKQDNNNNHLSAEHIATLNQTLDNNLSLRGVNATKREDGSVIIHSQGKLQTVSVAYIDEHGNLAFEEHNQSISTD